MKKLVTLILALALLVSSLSMGVLAEDPTALTEATYLYVATDGADTNTGSQSAPFATVSAAVEAARKIDGTVVINLKEGYYQITDTVNLSAEDEDLVIRAMPGVSVSLNGGVEIPYEDFKAVTDEAITGRIVERDARTKIQSVNLKDYGVEDYGEMRIQGFLSSTEAGYASTLSYKDTMLTIAEYPNGDEYLYTGDILDDGANSEMVLGSMVPVQYKLKDSQRYKKWTKAEDIWALAYYIHDWADATVPVTSVDFEKGIFNSYASKSYRPVTNRRIKYMNLLEEIDLPGEWYLDRNTGELYIYAPEGIKNGEKLVFNSFEKPFFAIDGAKNIKIENIRFAGNRAIGIDVKNADGIVINACEFTNIGDKAICFENCYNSGVSNSYLHDLGSWGVYMAKCGDRETLKPGNCFVTNCEIRTYSQYRKTYCPAIHENYGVGTVISYNEIHDAPHFAIRYDSNDVIIEYNEFYDVCQDTADTGAVYTGRHWNNWGNKLRYNYFHDLEMIATNTGMKTWAVYLDDMHSQTDVYSNVFYNVEYVALMGGGRNNSFTNNLMIDCANPLRFDSRGMSWSLDNITRNTNSVDWHTDVWAEKYPDLMNLMEDEPGVPKYNNLSGNVLYRTPEFNLDEPVVTYGTVENNISINDKKAFVDYAGKNFALAEDSIIYKKLPDFEQIPFDKIGRYDYTYTEAYAPVGGTAADVITLVIGSDKLYKGDEVVTLDVPAQVKNDRTLVPLRAIFEALGATVDWEETTQTVTSKKGDITIKLTIGSDKLYKNDTEFVLDVPAQVVNDRTLVPVRAISESFGCQVDWEEATQTVTIFVAGAVKTQEEEKEEQEEPKEPKSKKVYNILAFGNSYSQDAFTLLPEVAKSAGIGIYAVNMYKGGCSLEGHQQYMLGNGVYPQRVEYLPDGNKITTENVSFIDGLNTPGYTWDYISLQQRSVEAYDYTRFSPYVIEVADYIRKNYPSAEILLHQTWVLDTETAKTSVRTKDLVAGMKNEEIRPFLFDALKTNYSKAALEIGNPNRIVPVGEAVNYAIETLGFPEFVKDDSEKYETNSRGMYRDETCHLTTSYGRVLASLCWYEYITGNDARENAYQNKSITPEDMELLKEAAHYACSLSEYQN